MVSFIAFLMISLMAPPPDVITANVHLHADELTVGEEYHLHVHIELAKGWSASDAGIPQPILQIGVPPEVKLTGKEITTLKELAGNDFMDAPYEQLVSIGTTDINFTLVADANPASVIQLNLLAYVKGPGDKDYYFIRRRAELELLPDSRADFSSATKSDWGAIPTLQIGDTAQPFDLPRADGTKLSLVSLKGHPVIVTTYRAFW